MIKPTITDTGIVVGLIYEKDQWHEWTRAQFASLPVPLLTCEAVITEACFLLQSVADGEQKVLALLETGVLQIDFSLAAEIEAVKSLMKKYENVPMSLADACLVRMSEMERDAKIFTLDGDFLIYRKNGKQQIPLIFPE